MQKYKPAKILALIHIVRTSLDSFAVEKARKELSFLGELGRQRQKIQKAIEEDFQNFLLEEKIIAREKEFEFLAIQANEHISPIDPSVDGLFISLLLFFVLLSWDGF